LIRCILASFAVVAAGWSLAAAGCSRDACRVNEVGCADSNTMEVCVDPSSEGDVPLGGSVGGNTWNTAPCPNDNPFCVVLSSGPTCVSTRAPVPQCGDGGWLCLDQGAMEGTIAGECDDGFLKASSVCFGPLTCTVTQAAGAFCAPGAGGDDAAPPGSPDAGTAADVAAPDAEVDAPTDGGLDAPVQNDAGPGAARDAASE
jgi:hypothetical protein